MSAVGVLRLKCVSIPSGMQDRSITYLKWRGTPTEGESPHVLYTHTRWGYTPISETLGVPVGENV
jgi:hypothetical protein